MKYIIYLTLALVSANVSADLTNDAFEGTVTYVVDNNIVSDMIPDPKQKRDSGDQFDVIEIENDEREILEFKFFDSRKYLLSNSTWIDVLFNSVGEKVRVDFECGEPSFTGISHIAKDKSNTRRTIYLIANDPGSCIIHNVYVNPQQAN